MSAGIALLHAVRMIAEGCRAAVADRVERSSLMGTEYMSPFCEELSFVRAEDIGHFKPMLPHFLDGTVLAARIRSSVPSVSSGLLVVRTVTSATWR